MALRFNSKHRHYWISSNSDRGVIGNKNLSVQDFYCFSSRAIWVAGVDTCPIPLLPIACILRHGVHILSGIVIVFNIPLGGSGVYWFDYAHPMVSLFSENRIVGRGRTTEAAVERLGQGVPWAEAGTPSPSAGNGSAMRSAPVGLMFYDDPQQLMQVAHEQGLITHQDPQCSGGSVAIAGAVAFILQNQSFSTQLFIDQISQWVQAISPEFAREVLQLNQWIEFPPELAFKLISMKYYELLELAGRCYDQKFKIE
jgi:ADP-ribosylglycohydrolase